VNHVLHDVSAEDAVVAGEMYLGMFVPFLRSALVEGVWREVEDLDGELEGKVGPKCQRGMCRRQCHHEGVIPDCEDIEHQREGRSWGRAWVWLMEKITSP